MDDTETLARTLYGEAEANDKADVEAIAGVVLNRAANKKWPKSIAAVCRQPAQFSCWNADNPRLGKILTVSSRDKWYAYCYGVAARAVDGDLTDPTGGATHYYASYIDTPKWAKGKVPCHETPAGKYNHLFFNDIDTPKPRLATAAKVTAGATAAAGAASAVVDSGLLDQVKQAGEIASGLEPVFSLLGNLGPALPYLLVAGGLAVVGWLAWSWRRDRKDGGRT